MRKLFIRFLEDCLEVCYSFKVDFLREVVHDGPRSIRDAAFSLKLLALIDVVSAGFVDMIAGTGRDPQHRQYNFNNLMNQNNNDQTLTIDSADGWVFAFEGGAHILFRHTINDGRFVWIPSCLVEAVLTPSVRRAGY
jgi:hypothetical protein